MITTINKLKDGFCVKKMMKKQKGFTLIELLIVVAIIGLLVTIAFISWSGTWRKTRDARRESDIRQIGLAMEMAYDDDQHYPTSAAIPASIASSTNTYLATVPSDPQGGSYGWTDNTANDQTFCVSADLENGDFFRCTQDTCEFSSTGC